MYSLHRHTLTILKKNTFLILVATIVAGMFVVFPQEVYADVGYASDVVTQCDGSSCDAIYDFSYDAGTGDNRLLVVTVILDDPGTDKDVSVITYNGVSLFSNKQVDVSDGNSPRIQVFYLADPASGSNTLDVDLDTDNKSTVIASNFTGVNTASPVDAASTNSNKSQSDTLSISNDSGDMIIHMFSSVAASGWTTNQTEQWNVEIGGTGITGKQTVGGTAVGTGSSISMTANWSGNKEFSHGAFNINAAAAAAPTVTTDFASNVGATTANLNGTKTGGDNATEHGFAYGTDSTLATVIATTTLGALNSNSAFTSSVASLSADTTYYFRAYVTNSGGTGYGIIRSFVTGNTSVVRKLRLFAGFTIKFVSGRIILHQR